MADPVQYRDKAEENLWRKKDPIIFLREHLQSNNMIVQNDITLMEQEIDEIIDDAVNFADTSPVLPIEAIYEDIYAEEA